jgi:phospholipase C
MHRLAIMHRLARRQWIAKIALGAILGGYVCTPLYSAAQDSNNDAAFRLNEGKGSVSAQVAPPGAKLYDPLDRSDRTRTPIKHVILIIGENRTFDHVFATYQPQTGQTVHNLLSEGIVNTNGEPGSNVSAATQWQASNTSTYSTSPTKTRRFLNYLL